MKLVEVQWLDVLVFAGWHSQVQLEEENPPVITSIGWLVHEDKETIRLAGLSSVDDTWNAIQIIPKGCVISRKDVKEA